MTNKYSAHQLADGTFLILEQPNPRNTYDGIPQEPRVVFTVPHIVGVKPGQNPYTSQRAKDLVDTMNAGPEMLHALKLALGFFKDAARTSPTHFAGYFKAVSDAVAKAEGKDGA